MALTTTHRGTTWTTAAGNKAVTATPAVGDLVVIVCANSGRTTAQAPTVTDNNPDGLGTYTQVQANTKNTSADSQWVFVRDKPIGNASSTVFTAAQSGDTGGGLSVISVGGLGGAPGGSSSVGGVGGQSNQAAGTPSLTLSATPSSTSAIVGAVTTGTNGSANSAPPTSFTEHADQGYNNPASGIEVVSRASGHTSTTVAWTAATPSAFASSAVEIKALQTYAPALINQAAATFAPTVAFPTQAITVGLINQAAATFTPTITTANSISVGLINQTAATFAPTITQQQFVSFALIDRTASANTPVITATGPAFQSSAFQNDAFQTVEETAIVVALINQTAATFAPTVTPGAASIVLGLINQTATPFAPSIGGFDVSLPLISQAAATFAPVVTTGAVNVSLALVDRTAVAHAPTVTSPAADSAFQSGAFQSDAFQMVDGGGASITVALINQAAATFAPTVTPGAVSIVLGLINQTAVAHDPTISGHVVSLALIDQTAVTFAPTITTGAVNISLALINQTAAMFTPTVSATSSISVALINQGAVAFTPVVAFSGDFFASNPAVAFDPTVTRQTSVSVNRIGQLAFAFTPIVLLQAPQTVTLPLLSSPAATFSPTVNGGNKFIDFDDYIFNEPEVFTPSVQGGSTNRIISVALINRTPTVHAPTISPRNISLALINRTPVVHTPTITGGFLVQSITFGRIDNPTSSYEPTVGSIEAATVTAAPPPGTPVRVTIDGLGEVTGEVVWRLTELVTAVSGNSSIGVITMRDIGQTVASFPMGSRVTVDFGPGTRPIYSGYIWRAARRFWFSVDYPDTLQRQWRLAVVDINILMGKRVVYRQSDPANVTGPKYVSETYDDVALDELFDNWLDLSTDDLDLTTEVDRVGYINHGGQVSYPWNGGMTMGEAIRNIAQLPAAVYGINPSRQVVYADVDSENAPFVLTDEVFVGERPANRQGYRECTIYPDGSALINDFFAWGAGKGSNHMVFQRLASPSSIAEHDLWQDSFFSGAVWKQSTIDKVADSAVNGSPGSRRGHKNDRYEIRCVTHANGLVVGDRVRFISRIWDYEDVIPVRKVSMTFPTPYDVRYELTLSHEIDRWGFEDPLPPIYIPPFDIPLIDFPPITDPTLDDCVTTDYLHDIFNRTVSAVAGPYNSNNNTSAPEWGNGWMRDPDLITGDLVFPGFDEDIGGGTHLNRVSPILSPIALTGGAEVVVHFDAHDPGSEAFATHGVISSTNNVFRDVHLGDFEVGDTSLGTNAYVYYFWGAGEPFNSGLTGEGSYEFLEGSMGAASSSVGVTSGVAFIQVTNAHYGARFPYAANAANPTASAWAHPVSTGRFKIRFPTVPSALGAGKLRIRYGPASVEIQPSTSATQVAVTSGSGTTTDTIGGWAASSTDWHTVEVAVDLPSNQVTVRIYAPNGSLISTIVRALNGESAETIYQPDIAFRVESTTGSAFRFETTTLESSTYSDGTGIVEDFPVDVASNEDGWGDPWTAYISNSVLGPTPGFEWAVSGGYGIMKMIDGVIYDGAQIEQEVDGGSIDVSFSVRNYTVHSNFLTVYFGKTGGFTLTPRVQLGSTLTLVQGSGAGSTRSASTTIFNSGNPVNVHIRWSTSGIKVWLWAEGDEEPSSPTLEFARTLALPTPLVWGFQPIFFSDNEQAWVGPITGSGSYMHGKVGAVHLAYGTGILDAGSSSTGNTGDSNGRIRSWPYADPEDGRDYGVAWGTDVWVVDDGSNFAPAYRAEVVWGQFGNLGPGASKAQTQNVTDWPIPKVLLNGIHIDFDLIVSGECGIGFDGNSSGTGEATALAAINTYSYGEAGLPDPSYNDEFINGSRARAYVEGNISEGGGRTWIPFQFEVPRDGDATGIWGPDSFGAYHIQWGVHVEGAQDIIRSAGPFDQNGFLTAHVGVLEAEFRNISLKMRLKGVPVLNLNPGPCPPTTLDEVPDGIGTVAQSDAVRESGTVYRTSAPYVGFSLVVFVDGLIQRWGIDFTETDPLEGTFTFTNSLPETAVVNTQYTTRE